jgi:hypothetical protein
MQRLSEVEFFLGREEASGRVEELPFPLEGLDLAEPLDDRTDAHVQPFVGKVELGRDVVEPARERLAHRLHERRERLAEEPLRVRDPSGVDRAPRLAEGLHHGCGVEPEALADPQLCFQLGDL